MRARRRARDAHRRRRAPGERDAAPAPVTTFGYDAAGNRTSAVLPNGITTTWAYDARNRVTRIEHKTTATGTVQAFYESAWNAQGLRSTKRYSQAPGQGCLATYTYDRIGRRKQASTTHSPTCPTTGNYVYTHDAMTGRMKTRFAWRPSP